MPRAASLVIHAYIPWGQISNSSCLGTLDLELVYRIMLSAQYDMNCTGVITIIALHRRMLRLAGQLDKPRANESAKSYKA